MRQHICKYIYIHFLFLIFIVSNAFGNDSDSLKQLLTTKLPDTSRVNTLNAFSKTFNNTNPDSSVKIAMAARDLAEKIHFKNGLALAYKNMGIGYYLQGKYVEAIKTWQLALDVYQAMGNKAGVANMLSNQGGVYYQKGDDAKALELYLHSLKISEEVGDPLRIATALNNVGSVYQNKPATYKKALDYFLKSYPLCIQVKDDYLIGTVTSNLGEINYLLGDYNKALFYLKQSVEAYKGSEDLPYPLNLTGRVYTKQKAYDNAIVIHKEAFEYSKKLDTRLDMTQSLIGLAQAYQAKGDYDASIETYKNAVELGIELNAVKELKDAYQGLSESYSAKSDYNNAFDYQHLLLNIKDTIYNIDQDKKLGGLDFTFRMEKKESEMAMQSEEIKMQKLVRNSFIGGFAVVLLFAGVFFKQRNKISKGKKRSDELLLNILPAETAEELKATGTAKAKSFDVVSVLFTDFKNFTQASEKLSPEELVAEINHCYSAFDRIVTKYGIEKIKTIGDSYMCAGGLPVPNETHAVDIVSAGLEMAEFIEKEKQKRQDNGQPFFELRLGIHTGPVVAGIVGIKKFAYDIWGDTVNTASRMESSGEIGKVNISGSTYELVKHKFTCIHRGKIAAKNKGMIDMYFAGH